MPQPFEALVHELVQARTLFDLSRVDIEVFKRGFADLGARLEKLETNAHPPIEVVTPHHLANLVGEISDIKDQVAEIKGTVAAMKSGEWQHLGTVIQEQAQHAETEAASKPEAEKVS